MKNSLFIFSICLVSASVFPATYYVDTAGNDANAGTKMAPWRHIAYATCGGTFGCSCSVVNKNKINAGDTLFIRGGTYHEHSITIVNTGTRTNRMVIKSYHGEMATIDGDFVDYVFEPGMYNQNNWTTFDSLHVVNGKIANFWIGNNFPDTAIVIQNCLIENQKFVPGENCPGVEIVHSGPINDTVIHCTLRGLKLSNPNYDGIQLMGGDGCAVINCDISGFAIGVFYKHRSWGTRSTIISNNFIHDNMTNGIAISSNYVVVKNNLIVNNNKSSKDSAWTPADGLRLWWSNGSEPAGNKCRIDHNTIYNSYYTCNLYWGGGGYDTTVSPHSQGARNDTLVNNIFSGYTGEYGSYSVWAYAPDSAFTNNPPNDLSNFNLYYNTATSNVMQWQNKQYTLANWKTAHPTLDANSIQGKPIFANVSGTMTTVEDFALLPGSGYRVGSDGTDMGADISLFSKTPSTIERAGAKLGTIDTVIGYQNDSTFSYKIFATGGPLQFTASPLPGGVMLNTQTGVITGTPHDTGVTKATLTAANSIGVSPNFTLVIHIISASIPMVPTIVRSDSSQGYSDTITSYQNDSTFNYKIIATNRPTQYTASPLPSGLKLNAQTGLISGAPRDTGVTTATITAANASGISPNFTLVIHIIAAAILTVPTVLRSDGSQGNSDTITCYQNDSTFNYKIVATGGPLQYTASPLPKGLKLNSQTGVITGAPKDTGITRVTIKAANGNRVSSGFILIIHSIAVKIPNILRSDGTKGISDSIIGFLGDSTFNYTIIATGGPLQYTVSPLPKGLKLNSQTGVITGAPQDTGFTSLSITAVNADGVSPIFTLLIHVIPISVPNIASPQFTYAIIGRPFYYKISVSSKSDGFFASNLPIGLSLDNASGVISGTISSLSTIVSALSAKNNKGSSGDFLLKTVVIDVGNAGNHTPLPSGGDYIDTLSMSDTSLQGIGISLSAGPGDSAPKLLPNALSVIKTNTNSAIRISISSSLFNDVTGFRAKLIIRDSLKADTILLSRPIIRDHANCDDVFTQSLSWVPLSVTALPDSPAARQKLSSLFSDKGEYDKQKCRLLQWIASSGNSASLAEFGTLPDSLFNFKPGRLFWMKAVDSVPISFGKATTVALNDTFPITLSPNNWTDFSLPFLFPVMLSDIFSATQTKTGINYGDSLEFYHWKKSGISYSTEPLYLSRLSGLNSSEQTISGGVGKAFSIFNPYSNPVTLYFPPTCSAQTLVELKKKTSRPSHNQSAWSVKVKCHDDLGNVLADIYCGGDETLPGPIYYPVPPSFLSKSIQIMDSIHGKYHGAMVTNSKVNQGAIFSLLLSNNSDRWTTLSVAVESFINLPYNNKAVLIDLSASQAYINDKLSVSLGKGASQTIYLGVGTSTYISTMKNTISMAPGLRSMYPNPFRNFLCVQYVVPFKIIEGITFSLTDLQGKCIWSKTQQNPQSGIHELRINLDTKENTRLAAGIYLLRYSIIDNQKSVVMFHKRVFCM